jgi:hypothetical protein
MAAFDSYFANLKKKSKSPLLLSTIRLTFSYCQGYNTSCKQQNDSKERGKNYDERI